MSKRKNLKLAEAGRLGGLARSERKTAACRANALHGGWPKGKPRGPWHWTRHDREQYRRLKAALRAALTETVNDGDINDEI